MNEAVTDIARRIPHRPPFLFVDRILRESENDLTAEWDVAPDLACFAGHYPHHPVLPGVLITEFCLQSAALLLARPGAAEVTAESLPMLTRIEDARFKRIVRPGETLSAHVHLVEALGRACYMKARVTAGAEIVLDVRFTVALVASHAVRTEMETV